MDTASHEQASGWEYADSNENPSKHEEPLVS